MKECTPVHPGDTGKHGHLFTREVSQISSTGNRVMSLSPMSELMLRSNLLS